ncbi:redoxin domain-containing protein [Nitrosomonas sp.]|uniref:peroxiredoxin family protein n=1 Tax=Nitrosomonas sp. TaxID=42353 RepID=UPI00261281E3|nr:redoxin domain-containing protein [Nitrosomonas sp.]MCW5599513.1 redoxin domain-containing protein [Nitrosomonas sp.]MCW5602488.1 redoxin domain-containing protein [Nitrosomonas sp.]
MKIDQAVKKIIAPELQTVGWLNTTESITLASLRGKVVLLHAFQMLCPGCVQVGIPQTQRIYEEFNPDQVAVIGLHTVFEHHAVMGRDALEVFAYEYRLRFPIGIDKPSDQHVIPHTMMAYQMQGTPTTILIDKTGHLRLHKFGHINDFILGVSIGTLLAEEVDEGELERFDQPKEKDAASTACGPDGCAV